MTPKTILFVDDEESLLFSLKEGLKAYADRFTVLTAANGQEAVALLEAHSVDLLVTDLKMPKWMALSCWRTLNPTTPQRRRWS